MKNLLIVFFQFPNKNKDSLAVGAQLKKFLVEETLYLAREFKDTGTAVWILYAPEDKDQSNLWLKDFGACYSQKGKNKGERLFNAMQLGFTKKAAKVVLILGRDYPEMTFNLLRQSYEQLDVQDVVVGPTTGGEFYLIGMRKLTPDLFQEIDWSGDSVLEQILIRVRRTHLKYSLLPELKNML